MRERRGWRHNAVGSGLLLLSAFAAASVGQDTGIVVSGPPHPQVRYTSGQVVYVESLEAGRWLGRYWSAAGRINVPGEGWAEPAFQIEIDGKPLSDGWRWVSATERPRTGQGDRHLIVGLSHATAAVDVEVHTVVDGTPILTRWIEITNTARQPVALTSVAPWSGRLWVGRTFTLGSFTRSGHGWEGWFDWQPLRDTPKEVVCDKGQGHDDPFFIVRNDALGESFIGHLAWSANWRMVFQPDAHGLLFQVGPAAVSPLRVIDPGETIRTPAVHLGPVAGDLDTTVQAMHSHVRRSVLPRRDPTRSYRIQYLVPADQGYYTPLDEASALKCVDVAAAIGAELFILDAYWWDVTCDWVPSSDRFPRGLQPIIDAVREKGMRFGLYMEAEGGRGNVRDSRIAREHPDWLGPHAIINLAIPEAAAWVEAEICRLIEQYHIDLFRLDYNPQATGEGLVTKRHGRRENNYWRYYEACYAMYDRIRRRYPDVIFQQCAAGGARNDLGFASRFHETYLTDGLVIPRELQSFAGQTLGLPPEIFVILHGATGARGLGHPHNLDTVLRLTFTLATPQIFVGTVAPSIETLDPHRRERFLHYAEIYKRFLRPMLPDCRLYHHAPISSRGGVESSGWFVMEYAAPDRTKGWATLIRIGPSASDSYVFRPRGLDAGKSYRVTFDSIPTTATVDGLTLIRDGLPIRLEAVATSELLLFEAR